MNRFAYTSAEQFCDVQDTAGRKFRGQCSQKLIDDCYVNSRPALEFPLVNNAHRASDPCCGTHAECIPISACTLINSLLLPTGRCALVDQKC
jgi:hypothetical protein